MGPHVLFRGYSFIATARGAFLFGGLSVHHRDLGLSLVHAGI